ncbi:hypothetical protein F5X68DRAFT_62415 [Plectosphaerella plurivora]|uniref:Uncharacterized protein n=1 Tax=Plectosphaerella plurivora TaxID=936078 RepID=A0A9P9A3F6_9PEZI|nr:hypothetical protein F5X68DRAFT_62415 [Plectosphaerella plurivora]
MRGDPTSVAGRCRDRQALALGALQFHPIFSAAFAFVGGVRLASRLVPLTDGQSGALNLEIGGLGFRSPFMRTGKWARGTIEGGSISSRQSDAHLTGLKPPAWNVSPRARGSRPACLGHVPDCLPALVLSPPPCRPLGATLPSFAGCALPACWQNPHAVSAAREGGEAVEEVGQSLLAFRCLDRRKRRGRWQRVWREDGARGSMAFFLPWGWGCGWLRGDTTFRAHAASTSNSTTST